MAGEFLGPSPRKMSAKSSAVILRRMSNAHPSQDLSMALCHGLHSPQPFAAFRSGAAEHGDQKSHHELEVTKRDQRGDATGGWLCRNC